MMKINSEKTPSRGQKIKFEEINSACDVEKV